MNCYCIRITDGSVVRRGQLVQVQYMGNIHWFQVESLKSSTTSASGYHDSLTIDMSNMSLDVDTSTDSIMVDHVIVDNTNSDHNGVQSTDSSTNCNFFIITLQSQVIIQTLSCKVVSANA